MLHGDFHLTSSDLRCAIKANGCNAICPIEELRPLEVIEELALPSMVDILQGVHFIKHVDGFGMSQQKVFQITAFHCRGYDGPGDITVAWNNQNGTEIERGDKAFRPLE